MKTKKLNIKNYPPQPLTFVDGDTIPGEDEFAQYKLYINDTPGESPLTRYVCGYYQERCWWRFETDEFSFVEDCEPLYDGGVDINGEGCKIGYWVKIKKENLIAWAELNHVTDHNN